MFAQDNAAVQFCRTQSGDGGSCSVALLYHASHAAGGVFSRDPLKLRVRSEEALALGQRNGVRLDSLNRVKR